MTKQEFLNELGGKLAESMSRQEILNQLQYYAGYIDGEMARGKSESEAIADLGEPILIARTILESPREEDTFFGRSLQSEEEAYFEGSYQGENQRSTAEIKAAVKADLPLGTVSAEDVAKEERKEAEAEAKASEQSNFDADVETDANDAFDEAAADEVTADSEQEAKPQHTSAGGRPTFWFDENGGFRWEVFAVILGIVLVVTAVIYVAVKVLSALGPVLIGLILAGIAAYFVYRSLH